MNNSKFIRSSSYEFEFVKSCVAILHCIVVYTVNYIESFISTNKKEILKKKGGELC